MSKKTFMATIMITLLVLLVAGMQAVKVPKANVLFPTNLQISVISPTNKTYTSNSITLDINTSAVDSLFEKEKATQITYNLDRQGNLSTDSSHFWTTLPELSEGSHVLEVYAQNQYYNPQHYPQGPLTLHAYSVVYFTIDTSTPSQSPSPIPLPTPVPTSIPSPTPSPTPTASPIVTPSESPTQQPTMTPSPTASPTPINEIGNSNLILELAGIFVIAATVVVGLLVYFSKREGMKK